MVSAVLCLVNRRRTDDQLPRLHDNARLERSAQGWTEFMVSHDEFTHGSNFPSRITATGFHWSAVAENIATGFATPSSVVSAWMASPGHCRNILTPTFAFTGIGMTAAGVSGFGARGTWTEDFGLRVRQRAPSHNWGAADACPY